MEQFRSGLPRRLPFVTVPNFDSDLHDVAGLTRMHRYLFGAAEKPVTARRPHQTSRPVGRRGITRARRPTGSLR
jgi:hypothetical protein